MRSNAASPEIVKEAAEKIIGFFPRITASEPRIFLTGLIEILSTHSLPVVMRAASPLHGLPGKFKFMPSIAEIRDALEEWEAEEVENQERMAWKNRLKLPGPSVDYSTPKVTATTSGLCELYGVTAIPPGWDAVDMCRRAAKYGANLQAHIDNVISGRTEPAPPSVYQRVLEQARAAMEARRMRASQEAAE